MPAASVLTSPIVPIPLRFIVAVIWAFSLVAPVSGIVLLAIAAPFGSGLVTAFGVAPIQYTESLVLAALSGLLFARAARSHGDEPPASPSIVPPLVVFLSIVLASLSVALTISQIGLENHQLFITSFATFLARDYLISGPDPWTSVGAAAHLVEGGLLLLLARQWLMRDDGRPSWAILATAGAAAIAAAANLIALAPALHGAGSLRALATRLIASRISVEVSDVNAAGSYFAMASFVTLAMSRNRRTSPAGRGVWAAVTTILFVALWLTGSRTAVACVAVLLGIALAATRTTWRERPMWPIAAGVLLMMVASALVIGFDPRSVAGRSLERSFESRAAFLTTGLRMIASAPLFGVGIGRYLEESGRFMPSSIYWFFFRENAHNNFLQVGGELGLIGLVAFIWLICVCGARLLRGIVADSGDRLLRGVAGGLAAFVATWFTGHPLLTPEVAFPFWLLAGAAIARADGNRAVHRLPLAADATPAHVDRRAVAVMAAAIALLIASVPLRAGREAARQAALDSSFGFYEWEQWPGRGRTRWASPSAAFFVPAGTTEVEIPVRTMFSNRQRRPAAVSIAIDGRVFDRFELTNDDWRDVRLRLPPAPHPSQPRRIDIVTSPSWSLAELFGTRNARALGVQLADVKAR